MDLRKLALGMLPVTTVEAPKPTELSDRIVYEFLSLGAVMLADGGDWKPIVLNRRNAEIRIRQPIPGQSNANVQGLLTSQNLNVRHTVFILETDLVESKTLAASDLLPLVFETIHLLRTVFRQYWLGLSMSNEGSVFQAVRANVVSGIATFEGQGSFTVPFIVSPLTQNGWQFLGELLRNSVFPSAGEAILSDALLEVRRGDLTQAVLLLGVACETEVVLLLEQLATQQGLSNNQKSKLIDKTKFKPKFLQKTVELGADDPKSFPIAKLPDDWAESVCELYRLRNAIAHGDTPTVMANGIRVPFARRHLPPLIFAVEALLVWANQQRKKLGVAQYVTSSVSPDGNPIVAMPVIA